MPEVTKTPKTDIWKVKFSQLVLHPNPRDSDEIVDLSELVNSIRQTGRVEGDTLIGGVLQPLSGYRKDGKWYVIEGSRRYYAMEVIYNSEGLDTECFFLPIPQSSTEVDIMYRQLNCNTGVPLTPLEKSNWVKKLVDADCSVKDIATKLGISQTYVKRLHSLSTAPEELIKLIKKGGVKATFAMDRIAEGKAKVEEFLATHTEGKFAKYQDQEIFDEPEYKSKKEKKQGDITKKDLMDGSPKIPNSWNECKKYADKADYLLMTEAKIYSPVEVFQFILRLKNNEIAWEDVKDFFMKNTVAKERKSKDDIQDIETKTTDVPPLKEGEEFVVREFPK